MAAFSVPPAESRRGRWTKPTLAILNRMEELELSLREHYVGRGEAIRLLVLAAVCQEHLLLLGPPGTAKTDLVTRFARHIAADQFSYLLSRFTEPSEIFGPLDFERFRDSVYQVRTEGMLPTAQIAFLDEIFQGSSAILNTLLTLVNERVFHNGAEPQKVPLISLVGASNDLPADPGLDAFADRFLLRLVLDSVSGTRLPELLRRGWEVESERRNAEVAPPHRAIVTVADLEHLYQRLPEVEMREAVPAYREVVAELLAHRITLSDRRIVRGLRLVAAAALLDGADRARPRHLWPLCHFWTDRADVDLFTRVVQPRVEQDGGAPVRVVRAIAEILHEAANEAEPVGADGGPVPLSPFARGDIVRRLGRLLAEAMQDHPDNTAAADEIRRLRDHVARGWTTEP